MLKETNISCIIVDDESIARDIIAMHLSKIPSITIVANCSTAIEALHCIRNQHIDLIFLDINMPEISGISFAKSIDKSIKIIFTTAYRNYAVEGFELQAVDYLLKPISFDRLLKSVNNYFNSYLNVDRTKIKATEINDFMFVRADRRMIKIDFNTIIYIESYSDYLKIHLMDKTIVTRETISAIEGKLPKSNFLRIHRSFIISISNISSFTNEEVIINDKALTISRSYKKEVLSLLEKY